MPIRAASKACWSARPGRSRTQDGPVKTLCCFGNPKPKLPWLEWKGLSSRNQNFWKEEARRGNARNGRQQVAIPLLLRGYLAVCPFRPQPGFRYTLLSCTYELVNPTHERVPPPFARLCSEGKLQSQPLSMRLSWCYVCRLRV